MSSSARPAGASAAPIISDASQHVIDLFAWPAGPDAREAADRAPDGYHLRRWAREGFNRRRLPTRTKSELDEFVRLWRAA